MRSATYVESQNISTAYYVDDLAAISLLGTSLPLPSAAEIHSFDGINPHLGRDADLCPKEQHATEQLSP